MILIFVIRNKIIGDNKKLLKIFFKCTLLDILAQQVLHINLSYLYTELQFLSSCSDDPVIGKSGIIEHTEQDGENNSHIECIREENMSATWHSSLPC